MMKKLALTCALLFSPMCFAGTGTGPITQILAVNTGQVFVTLATIHQSPPACATIQSRWVVDGTTPAGKAVIAALYTAYATNSQIMVVGTNECGIWGDTESLLMLLTL
jgi:hypothetical protein